MCEWYNDACDEMGKENSNIIDSRENMTNFLKSRKDARVSGCMINDSNRRQDQIIKGNMMLSSFL